MGIIKKTIFDVAILVIVGLPILLFDRVAKPTERGFFKDDESLSYPYHGSTVPSWALYTFGFGVPFIIIILLSVLTHVGRNANTSTILFAWQSAFPIIIGYLLGAAGCQVLTDVCKYTVGRLRPHFFDVCRPEFDNLDQSANFTPPRYVVNYTCIGNELLFPDETQRFDRIREVHLSFPSGHASFAFQSATFSVLFLQTKFKTREILWVPLIQIVIVTAATFTAVSRVMDNKHHPTDVLAGTILGIICQVLNVFGVMRLFSCGSNNGDQNSQEDNVPNSSTPLRGSGSTTAIEGETRRRIRNGNDYNSV